MINLKPKLSNALKKIWINERFKEFCSYKPVALSDFKYGLFIAIFFFAVQYFKPSRWERCFITEIKLENQELLFKYKEENQEKEILGQQSDFKLIKEIALNKTRTIYLAVYFKGSLILKQFEVGEWNEGKIDEVIKQIAIV